MNERFGLRRLSITVLAVAFGVMTLGAAALAAEAPAVALPTPESASPIPPATADQDAPGSATPASALVGSEPDGPILPADAPATDVASALSVRLRVDGNVAGRVAVLDSSGQVVPVRARIVLIRNGQVIAAARSDDTGAFQMLNVAPGPYSVMAVGREGLAAFTVLVVPFDGSGDGNGQSADANGQFLTVSLVPFGDFQLAAALLGLQAPPGAPLAAPMQAPPAGVGGGGGGGEALLPLVGLSGLAGFGGGVGGGQGVEKPASPDEP